MSQVAPYNLPDAGANDPTEEEEVFIFPASFAQQRLWFMDQFEPDSPFYNIPVAVRLLGALDRAALEQALDAIVERHESLRTTFATLEGQPVQVITPAEALPAPRLPLTVADLGVLPAEAREAEALRLATEEARRPFNLARGPLVRARLLRLTDHEHIVLFTLHHIISDGWSMGVLIGEVAALYAAFANGRPSPLPDLPIQYADFADWQRNWLQGEVLEAQLGYWRTRLGGGLPVLELPTDRPRPAVQTSRGASLSRTLPRALAAALTDLSRREGATLFMTLLAAFDVLLSRYSGQTDFAVGTPIANRTRAEIEGLIGFFVNTLVLRADLSGNPTFRDLLRRVRETALGAYAHQDLPFEMLVEVLQPERDMSHSPLFQVMFILQNAPARVRELPGMTMQMLDVDSGIATFDLTLSMTEQANGLDATMEFNTDLFDHATIERMLAQLEVLLTGIAADPDAPVARLPLLPPAERERLLVAWSGATQVAPVAQLVIDRFAAQVARDPTAIAVTWGAAHLTYAELDGRANQLAHRLQALGVGAETLVGVCLERSLELIVAVLGVLKAGGAYLPLDLAYPAERIAAMIADARPLAVLYDEAGAAHALAARHPVSLADWSAFAAEPATAPVSGATLAHLAYVIYTSGSTGQSKGALIAHQSLAAAYAAWERSYELRPTDSHLQMASFSFDVFTGDLVRALCSGGRLVLCPRDLLLEPAQLYALIEREQITCAEFVPAVLRGLMQHLDQTEQRFTAMRLLACGSDSWYVGEYRQFRRRCGPATRLINSFGLTEATIDSTFFEATSLDLPGDQLVPIGRPFAGSTVYILDQHGQPAPTGVPGELHIGGLGIARGYLNRPHLTAERFIPHPVGEVERGAGSGERDAGQRSTLYRTGDRARFLADGNIEFLGRMDFQVKIRGFRIEPGEIEAVLSRHPAVAAAAVAARTDAPGGARLVAYVVAPATDDPQPAALAAELRRWVQDRLPDYMVPSAFVLLDALPLTPNGKVDRQNLPAPDWSQRELAESFVAPRTPVEELLAGIWSEVLGTERIGVHDNFFDLGGHSLLATQLMSRVRSACQIELPLRVAFEAPTVAELAERVEIAQRSSAGTQAPPLRPVPRDGALPLSFAQQRLWFLDQLEPGSPFYNIPETMRINGPLDVALLERALNEIIRRHEALRTTFVTVDGRPRQVIAPEVTLALPITDLRHLAREEREAEALRLAGAEAQRPFDLAHGPLLRARVLRLADDDHVVLLVIHHIISDDWSTNVFVGEISALYAAFANGRPSPLPDLPIQYADFAAWQREWLQGEVLAAQLGYWRDHLAGAPPLLELPADRPRPPVQTFQGSYTTFALPPELARRLQALSRHEGATLFMTLLAAFNVLLSRYSNQHDIVVGTPIANRTRAEIEGLIGFFVNTLVLRTDLSGEPGFRALLRRVRETALGAYAHQDVPFEMIVDALQPERNLSHTPLFQVMFVLQNTPMRAQDVADLLISPVEAHSGAAKFDLTLFMLEEGESLAGALEYSTDLFDAATIERMIGHFTRLLEGIVADPDMPVTRLPLLSAAEEQTLLGAWNATARPLPAVCFHDLFAAQAARTPDAVALVCRAVRLSYAELNARANQLAHALQARGVGPETLVAVCMERTPELLVALLGILKAGGAYLPIDPTYPAERIAFMLEDARPLVVLDDGSGAAALAQSGIARQPIALADWAPFAGEPTANPPTAAGPDNLAYVIYTSGSTGRPKGAMIVHRGLVNYLTWAVDAYRVAEGAGAPVHSSIAFDLTITGLFAPLLAGRAVHLLPADGGIEPLSAALEQADNLSLVKITPAHLEILGQQIAPERAAGRTRAFIIGGENLRAESVRFWLDHAPATMLINEYGPTETVVGCCVYQATPDDNAGSIPIGRPIANTQLYVLDRRLQPVPVGVPGELYIGGAGVARGYLNRPDLTAERFVPNPFAGVAHSSDPRSTLYKTGDLARYRPDGTLEYLGRIDHQVKVRGFRIELGEIEAVLAAHPAVGETCVIVREDTPGHKRLVAYVAPAPERAPEALGADLREFLAARLPDYMVPAAFVPLAALPLTPNGKVDRAALERMALDPATGGPSAPQEYVAPRTPTEQALADIWAQLLNVERVSIHANFFELGGDSILSIQVIARANQAGLGLTPRQLFQAPTVAGLAALAGGALAEQGPVTGPVALTPAQQRLLALELPAVQQRSQALWLEVRRPLDRPLLEQTLAALLAHHDALRLRFTRDAAGWRQHNAGLDAAADILSWFDLAGLAETEQTARIAAALPQIQAGLDLEHGPLLRVAYFDRGPQRHGLLLLLVHDLALDRATWRILLEDMQAAAIQIAQVGAAQLPPKTAAFQRWAAHLAEQAHTAATHAELDYWLALGAAPAATLPLDGPNGAAQAVRSLTVALDAEATRALIEQAPAAYRTTTTELALTALAQTLTAWIGSPRLLVELEGDGRATASAELDLTRTAGCFTMAYPAQIDLSGGAEPGAAITAVKEQLRGVPHNGAGYGMLRFMADTEVGARLAALPAPQVAFACDERLDPLTPAAAAFAPVDPPVGADARPALPPGCLLAVAARFVAGRLCIEWSYNAALHTAATVERLAQECNAALHSLIAHCQNPDAGSYSAADFAEFGWSDDDLADIMAQINQQG